MNFIGDCKVFLLSNKAMIIEEANISNLCVNDLQKVDKKCSQCMEFFEEGDDVFFIAKSIYRKDDQKFEIDEGEFVHIQHPDGKSSCLEDYISRLVSLRQPQIVDVKAPEPQPDSNESKSTPE